MEILQFILCFFASMCVLILPVYSQNEADAFPSSLNRFTLDLYKQLSSKTEGNLISSPLGADIVMSMLLVAAQGETANQLNKTLHYNEQTLSRVQSSFRSVVQTLTNNNGNNTFRISDSVWIQEGTHPSELFSNSVKNDFLSALKNIDFVRGQEASQAINSWVNSATNGQIPTILDEPLDSSTAAVLINAIYFKGIWEHKFKKDKTSDEVFYSKGSTNHKKVPMMNQLEKFRHTRNDSSKVSLLEMRYEGKDISMVILLPDSDSSLDMFESNLDLDTFLNLLVSAKPKKVNVTLPRFEGESFFDLKDPLNELGIKDVFTSRASLPGIGSRVYVSEVIQKAKIKVDEEGSEASAVTIAQVNFKMALMPDISIPVEFKANRPFTYAIVDKRTNVILFMGRVTKIQ